MFVLVRGRCCRRTATIDVGMQGAALLPSTRQESRRPTGGSTFADAQRRIE